jgi:putative RNA 2'-phosphotransferase
LTLQTGGWVGVEDLLRASEQHGMRISRAELEEIVALNDKQRFSFDDSGSRIRANQGHSVTVDLQLEPLTPPAVLYHGTGHRSVDAILRDGLRSMSRQQVHLSTDVETARKVGARHGRPVVLTVDALAMSEQGHRFYCSDNGVWLVDQVPSQFLTLLPEI